MKHKTSAFTFLLIAFLSLTLWLTLPSQKACAQTSACDPQYMDALEARAWMEAQREISQNQNLIAKPNSVLAYTCFDRLLGNAAKNIGSQPPFSQSSKGVVGNKLSDSLTEALKPAVDNHLFLAFNHSYTGDRPTTSPEGAGKYKTVAGPITGQHYACDEMKRAWEAAKCVNFQSNINTDAFFDFPQYSRGDPRKLPKLYAQCGAPNLPYTFGKAMAIAFNNKPQFHTLAAENLGDTAPYQEDPVISHLDKTRPGACAAPIPTGLIISRSGSNYMEHICPNPGCVYIPGNTTPGSGSCSRDGTSPAP